MKKEKKEEKINDALLKVALGCSVAEVTEEYAEVDGTLKLTKRKKTKRDIPPDLKAVQLLMAAREFQEDFSKMSDEELLAEKRRLVGSLKEAEKGEGKAGLVEADLAGTDGIGESCTDGEAGFSEGLATAKPRKKRAKPRKRRVVKSCGETAKK